MILTVSLLIDDEYTAANDDEPLTLPQVLFKETISWGVHGCSIDDVMRRGRHARDATRRPGRMEHRVILIYTF